MSASMLGGPFSAYGAIQQGQMTSDSLNNQANNLQAQADEAESKGKYDAMRETLVSNQKIGTSIASYGASGVAANSGSALDVIQASHQNSELDRLNILHGADIRAINYQNQASMDRYGAQSAKLGSYWQALGSITGGAITSNANTTGATPKGGEGAGSDMSAENASAESGGEGASAGEAGAGAGADTGASAAAFV